jgi:hypothetical protein
MQTVNTLCQNTSKECPAVYGPPILKYATLNFIRVEKELIFDATVTFCTLLLGDDTV